jgi:subtilisin family serine protease
VPTRRFLPWMLSVLLAATGLFVGSSSVTRGGTPEDSPPRDASQEDDRIPGKYLVDLKPHVDAKRYAERIAEEYGGRATVTYDAVIGGFAFQGPDSAAPRLARDRRVEFVEQDRKVRIVDSPPDNLNHLNRDRVPEAFNAGYTGGGVTIAILDTGVDGNHEVFDSHDNVLDRHSSCGGGADDRNGHGTATASNAAGRIGVAHEAKVISIKVFPGARDTTRWSCVVNGLQYVKQHASEIDIVNMSLAGTGTRALSRAVQDVLDEGIVVVAAAGNNGGRTLAPARYDGVIAASALAGGDKMARWSASGDLTAPGAHIRSADKNGAFSTRSGTSRSSPQVAGAAAIVLAENPGADVLNVLRRSGTCPNGDVNGSPSFCAGRWTGDDANAEPLINAYCAGIAADPVGVDLAQCGF